MCSFPAIFGHTEVIGHSPNQEAFTPPVAFGSITGTLRAALLGMSRRGGIATYLSDRDVILFRFPVNRAAMRRDEPPPGCLYGETFSGPIRSISLQPSSRLKRQLSGEWAGWRWVGWSLEVVGGVGVGRGEGRCECDRSMRRLAPHVRRFGLQPKL